jgi:hypothetical protein
MVVIGAALVGRLSPPRRALLGLQKLRGATLNHELFDGVGFGAEHFLRFDS